MNATLFSPIIGLAIYMISLSPNQAREVLPAEEIFADVAGTVVFAAERDTPYLNIFTVKPSGGDVKLLIPGKVPGRGSHQPHISPDGRRIAFNTYQYSGWKLAVSNLDGSQMRRLTNTPHYEYDASWSPDGKSLLISLVVTKGPPYYQGNRQIIAVDFKTGKQSQLTHDKGIHTNPSFSPDSQAIVWDNMRTGNIDIWLMDADGKNQRNLTRHPSKDMCPSFSPDGKRIAFQRYHQERLDLWVMDLDGKNLVNLTADYDLGEGLDLKGYIQWKFNTCWSPDGKHIVFTSGAGRFGPKNLDVYIVSADGKQLGRVTQHPGQDTQPIWVP